MFSLFLRCDPDQEDRLVADLWEQNTIGVADEPGGLRAFFDDDSRSSELIGLFRAFAPELRLESDTNWAQVSRDAWPPMAVGQRFFLTPPWCDHPTPPGRLRLEINPGMACGSGQHPATQLCLEAMERYVRPGSTVLDVGTGSGILAAAARLLGAARVFACDIDPEATAIASARVNTLFFTGSVDAVASGIADVIVANIDSATIERLRLEFDRVRRRPGTLILSGFPHWDSPEGFKVTETRRREEWLCLVA